MKHLHLYEDHDSLIRDLDGLGVKKEIENFSLRIVKHLHLYEDHKSLIRDLDILGVQDEIDFDLKIERNGQVRLKDYDNIEREYKRALEWNDTDNANITKVEGKAYFFLEPDNEPPTSKSANLAINIHLANKKTIIFSHQPSGTTISLKGRGGASTTYPRGAVIKMIEAKQGIMDMILTLAAKVFHPNNLK